MALTAPTVKKKHKDKIQKALPPLGEKDRIAIYFEVN
jgi:hypothetical protein